MWPFFRQHRQSQPSMAGRRVTPILAMVSHQLFHSLQISIQIQTYRHLPSFHWASLSIRASWSSATILSRKLPSDPSLMQMQMVSQPRSIPFLRMSQWHSTSIQSTPPLSPQPWLSSLHRRLVSINPLYSAWHLHSIRVRPRLWSNALRCWMDQLSTWHWHQGSHVDGWTRHHNSGRRQDAAWQERQTTGLAITAHAIIWRVSLLCFLFLR